MLELIEDLMALALHRVRQLKAEQMLDNADVEILSSTLDHLALDTKPVVSTAHDLTHLSLCKLTTSCRDFQQNSQLTKT